jgi:hypothetical protein
VKTPAQAKATAAAEKEQSIDSEPGNQIDLGGKRWQIPLHDENGQMKQIDAEKLRMSDQPVDRRNQKAAMGSFCFRSAARVQSALSV